MANQEESYAGGKSHRPRNTAGRRNEVEGRKGATNASQSVGTVRRARYWSTKEKKLNPDKRKKLGRIHCEGCPFFDNSSEGECRKKKKKKLHGDVYFLVPERENEQNKSKGDRKIIFQRLQRTEGRGLN